MRTKSSGPKFAAIYHWEMKLPAYLLLSVYGRALLIEFRRKYNTHNNGDIAMSVRQAAQALGCCLARAFKTLGELEDKGWIRPMQTGSFHWKTDAGGRKYKAATTWRITNQALDLGVDTPATKEYMKWKPEI